MAALAAEHGRVGAGRGRCVLVRGRRRVGKSWLIEQFCSVSNTASVFFTASQQGAREPGLFASEVLSSNLPGRDLFEGADPTSWDAALRLLASAVGDTPTIVVIDEFPYLIADDKTIEATFQKQWDRLLSKRPILLILVGSDIAMMEALNTHNRAFFQRGVELIVPPLSPAETGELVGGVSAADAFDAYLITGGLPLICTEWRPGLTMWAYLEAALGEPTSPLIVSAERALAAEFPREVQARDVLGRIGADHVTFSHIARAGGGMQAASLNRALEILSTKRMITKDLPLSIKPSREARYSITDSYLRFWLRFIAPHLAEIERGRSDRVLARIRADWTTWRGRAIEPVIREALSRLSPIDGLPAAAAVGGFWTRSNKPEIDIVGADRGPIANTVEYIGSIKWLEGQPLDQRDLNALIRDRQAIPGTDDTTPIVAVSRSGVTAGGAINLGPDDLLAAWP